MYFSLIERNSSQIRDAVDGPPKEEITNNHNSVNYTQGQNGEEFDTPGELPVHAFAKALYPFKGKNLTDL